MSVDLPGSTDNLTADHGSSTDIGLIYEQT